MGLAENKREPRAGKDVSLKAKVQKGLEVAGRIKIDTCSLCNEELCQPVLKITHGGDSRSISATNGDSVGQSQGWTD